LNVHTESSYNLVVVNLLGAHSLMSDVT